MARIASTIQGRTLSNKKKASWEERIDTMTLIVI
jgi:hypothetical protein